MVRYVVELAVSEVLRLEALMSVFRSDSEVCAINRMAGRGAVAVTRDTLTVVARSLWASRVSAGAFDVTTESLRGLFAFDAGGSATPDPAFVAERRAAVDYRHVHVDDVRSTVYLDRADVRISLGGIAKGYAVDRAAAVLLQAGIADFMIQAGGDLYLHGTKADGSPWTAGVRDPRGPAGTYFAVMPVADSAFSTAGDYERSYLADGRRYHHILDPRTGYPATRTRSATVCAPDAQTADALDDAVFVLGPENGLALVNAVEGGGRRHRRLP
jgi:thiamine biosynthesis lipoprotein